MSLAFSLDKGKPLRDDSAPIRGYRMIDTFDIKNFRCFKDLSLKDLSHVNVIVGDNASGKTALLEALVLAANGQPAGATILRLSRIRSLPQTALNWNRDLFHSLWDDLFFNFDPSQPIVANLKDSHAGKFRVKIRYERPESEPAFSAFGSIPSLIFDRLRHDDKDGKYHHYSRTSLRIDEKGNPVVEGRTNIVPPIYFLTSTTQFFAESIVDNFSNLSRQNVEKYIIDAMEREFPDIENISVLKDVTEPVLWVTTKSVPDRKIPLSIVSAGAARYLNILLAIVSTSEGVVLVDEIENGIYWKKMTSVWDRLRELCVDLGIQLFAATHSYECLQALVGAMKGHEEDFSLIRTEVQAGKHVAKQFLGKSLLAALEQRAEVR